MRCVALLSGGLDSMLAVRVMQEQGLEVEAVTFRTVFSCCRDQASQAARELDVPITVLRAQADYLDVVRHPRFGYGRGANPCVDCRMYMVRRAKQFMKQIGASFIVTGEILGQRPMSQKRRDLHVIAHHSGCDDLLLRPLSAKLLPPTLPEREGWVDRDKLYDFSGRSRKGLIALANRLGLQQIESPSTGCALTERWFSLKVFDVLEHVAEPSLWDFDLLKVGRHFRYDARTKVVVGRDEAENDRLAYLHQLSTASSNVALYPENFNGPYALVVGPATEEAIAFAGGLIFRYTKRCDPDNALLVLEGQGARRQLRARPHDRAQHARTLSTPPED